jgi:hypothetical protein
MKTTIDAKRCTNVTYKALTGKEATKTLMYGTSLTEELGNNGFSYRMTLEHLMGKTLKALINENPKGKFYIATSGHALAFVNGKLIDTMGGGLRKKIQYIFEVKENAKSI